jgi:hypothetical protein
VIPMDSTLLEPRSGPGDDFAVLANRQLTSLLVKRDSVCAALSNRPVDFDIGSKRDRFSIAPGESRRAGQ